MILYITSFKIKIFLYMKLESFREAKNMPEKYLPSLVDAEIECWWSRPFSEFRICKSDICKATYSIEDVYWSIKEYQKMREQWKNIEQFDCQECNSETWYVYEKGKFTEVIRDYIKWTVSSILLLWNNDIVRGFWIVTKKSIKDLLELELNTRPWSYNKEDLLTNLSLSIYWKNNAWDESVIYFNHLFIWEELRQEKYWWLLMQKLIKFVKYYNDIPTIIETKIHSNVYYFMKRMWLKDSFVDKYWYVVMYLCNDNCSYRDILKNLMNTKNDKDNLRKLVEHSSHDDRLFYH